MTTLSPEAKKITEKATIEESCRPELDAMGKEEIEIVSSIREPISQVVQRLKKDEALVQEALDRFEEGKGSKRRGTELLVKAIREIQNIYNSEEALEGLRDALRDIERRLRRAAELRHRRMEALQEWDKLLSGVEGYQSRLGAQLPGIRQEARQGEIAATFELYDIEKELKSIQDIIENTIQPVVESEGERNDQVLSQEDLKHIETRLQGMLTKIQSLLVPKPSSRGTGSLSKGKKHWDEGEVYQA